MNKCFFVGRLGSEIELRSSATGGVSFGTVNIACNKSRKVDDKWETETTWVSLIFFGKNAENATKVLKKGDLIAVEAEYAKREYKTKEGTKAYAHNFKVNDWEKVYTGAGKDGDVAFEEDEDSTEEIPF